MRVLITNVFVDQRGGTQLYVAELATELLRRGHHPMVFSPTLGPVADSLIGRTVPVVSDLARIGEPPDVIHGHHTLETVAALVRFPEAPAIYVTHDWMFSGDAAPIHPRIYRYLAVDDTLRDRLVAREGIDARLVHRTRNWVDLDRYALRAEAPNRRPERALAFSNQAADDNFLPAIRAACAARGITLDVAGTASGNVIDQPERVLGRYDVVFAKARSAMEAMACGCAVILCDFAGFGGLVDSPRFADLKELNFGRRALAAPITAEAVGAALDRYDADDAMRVAVALRAGSSLVGVVDELIDQYGAVIDLHAAQPYGPRSTEASRSADGAAAARIIGPLSADYRRAAARAAALPGIEAELARARSAEAAAQQQIDMRTDERDSAAAELLAIRASSTFVLRDRLWSSAIVTRVLLPVVRRLAGRSGQG